MGRLRAIQSKYSTAILVLDLTAPLTAFYSVSRPSLHLSLYFQACCTAYPFLPALFLTFPSNTPSNCLQLFLPSLEMKISRFQANNRKLIQNSRVKIFNISMIIFLKRNTEAREFIESDDFE